jgi:rhodanese-related sulfurtransferase
MSSDSSDSAGLRRLSPAAAKSLCDEGWSYVDVRSEPEFAEGHPVGAYNVPLLHKTAAGLVPNPDFLSVMLASFAKDDRLVIGCKAGGRSLKAAEALLAAGFTAVVDQRAGFDGVRDAFGSLAEPGWKPAGLPIAVANAAEGRSYRELAGRAAR